MAFLDIVAVEKHLRHQPRAAGHDAERRRSTRWCASSGRRAAASPRCCAASTASRPSTAARSVLEGERVSGRGVDLNWLRQEVGIVFQSFNLFPHMTVLDNITLGPRKVLGVPKRYGEERAMALLDAHRAGREGQRVPGPALRAASSSASPSCGRWPWGPRCCCSTRSPRRSTPSWCRRCSNIVRELAAEGMTMLLATHEMGFAKEVASKVVFLSEGVVCEEGPPGADLRGPHRGAHPRLPPADHRSRTAVAAVACL